MTFNELAEAWNQLRNAAWGRGVEPVVSRPLADQIEGAHERFKAWLADQHVITDAVATTLVSKTWIELHRQFAAKVRAEGKAVPELPDTPLEVVENAISDTAKGIGSAIGLVLGVGLGVGLLVLLLGRRGER